MWNDGCFSLFLRCPSASFKRETGYLEYLLVTCILLFTFIKQMAKLVLEISNQKDLELLLSFAKRLKVNILEVDKQEQSPVFWLEQLAKIDSFKDIDDPVEWQRNTRKERELPFRD